MPKNGPIIVVDDDQEDHLIMQDAFREIVIDQRLVLFDRATDFLEFLRTTVEQPFIIFCDINMPGMNGIEMRNEIVTDSYLREKSIPFVFYSTAANPQQIRMAYELTVQGFFQKPASYSELVEMLRLIMKYWKISRHPNDFK
ncbi:MAG TPA: response regulator [Flavitalea sp.]|nr:response regulator [Flavitalea sp.]